VASLDRSLRKVLENAVKTARRCAEAGARKAVEQLAVHHREPWPTMTQEQQRLRRNLRAHGRQLGDRRDPTRDTQAIDRLVAECAYEHWHRLLFARFLAENDLLIEPDSEMPLSLDECRELARARGTDWLPLASAFAQSMLPQIFRAGDPVLDVSLPPETRQELEQILEALPRDVFLTQDSLGWVYQYWQAERKDQVNGLGIKIGAEELSAVTQLFTEDYMVLFLLHNTLGAWWAGKHLAAHPDLAVTATTEDELRRACALPGIDWTWLRFVRDPEGKWQPAAGTFASWPRRAADLTVLDPCMGSGHFLVFSLPILVALRSAEEGLSVEDAVDAVLRDNLFGLELDPRCTQIAAFNLALSAWRMAGYRPLPPLELACSGLRISAHEDEWLLLANGDHRVESAMKHIFSMFSQAPVLGSLIDPQRVGGEVFEADFQTVLPLVREAFKSEIEDDNLRELSIAAKGVARAADILVGNYSLVITNVPYLGRGRQSDALKHYCEKAHEDAKADLATCFLDRCLRWCGGGGTIALVTPQNWLFQEGYRHFRLRLLSDVSWNCIVQMGEHGFESQQAAGAFVALAILSRFPPTEHQFLTALDALQPQSPSAKANVLLRGGLIRLPQATQRANPDSRVVLSNASPQSLLSNLASSFQGIKTGDDERVVRFFWEIPFVSRMWRFYQGSTLGTRLVGGLESILWWEDEGAGLARKQGMGAWNRPGIMVSQMRSLPVARYFGDVFDSNASPIVPADPRLIPALWAYCSDSSYCENVRTLDQALKPTNASLVQVPFERSRWEAAAARMYPQGLPPPQSSDPTQWIFVGNPRDAACPLHVSVARMSGFLWPRQVGKAFPDCPAVNDDDLASSIDGDGIVSITSLHGEAPAAERLRSLLALAFGSDWCPAKLDDLLAQAGYAGRGLDVWLREAFFEQHCDLFHQRPFIWHIWDGLNDGFGALVNYHRLAGQNGEGRRTLEKLIYSYLGDWIDRQRADQAAGVEGADVRVAAAEHLKRELEKILEGEPPYDLFIRWKPLHEQPIGWEPDVNDGVRMNIRPFLAAKPWNARGRNASILRSTPKIKWDKDRGKEPPKPRDEYPWFWNWDERTQDFPGGAEFDGNRWNNLHYTRASRLATRDRAHKGGPKA